MNNVGKFSISEKLILQWLQLDGGKIKRIEYAPWPEAWNFIVEHPEMPEVKEGDAIPQISLSFVRHQDNAGRWVAIREPIKKPC